MSAIDQAMGERWASYNGDSAEVLPGVPDRSVGFTIFSPPFADLYVYSASERDLGNCRDAETFWGHFGFISRELLRVMLPGRLVAVHVMQIPLLKERHGVIALRDFRGETIRHFTEAGFAFHGEVTIDKCPQIQAIRTHVKGLAFPQLRKDASWMRPALADYLLLFRAPGENPVPVLPAIDNDTWIEWARPIWQIASTAEDRSLAEPIDGIQLFEYAPGTPLLWYGITEPDTLNALRKKGYGGVLDARERDDDRHICPLQLGLLERAIGLWSMPGEVVLDPFSGIASTGYEALKADRLFVGIELKPAWWRVGVRNLRRAEQDIAAKAAPPADLFSALESTAS
jgi:hypothetical protein